MNEENENLQEESIVPEEEPRGDDGAEELEQLRTDLENANAQIARLQNERYLLSRGVPEEDLDYYLFKIGQVEGAKDDFKGAAKSYLKNHPIKRATVSSGAELNGSRRSKPQTANEMMNSILRDHR